MDEGADLALKVVSVLRNLGLELQRYSVVVEDKFGVSASELWFMQELHLHPGLRVSDLTERIAMMQGSVSNISRTLMQRGYVRRVAGDNDRRAVRFYLTEKGHDLITRTPYDLCCLVHVALKSWPPERSQQMYDYLTELLSDMEKYREGMETTKDGGQNNRD